MYRLVMSQDVAPGYLTLGELITALEVEDPNRVLPFGFTNPHSWRGSYDELAFEPAHNVTIGHMLESARSAVGTTYEGWKGGHYTMDRMTTCWISEEGHSSGDRIGPILLHFILAQNRPAR